LLIRIAGSRDPDGKAPLDMRLTFLGRRAHARAAVMKMLACRPERVILSHGRCYSSNAVTELKRAFRWVGDLESGAG
jgi:hypothetical protein